MPYTTTAPASCKTFATSIFDSSSKRARSSMTAVTSLPLRAASASTCTISESAPLRYNVCLIASTCGSRADSRNRLMTGAKDSNG